MGTSIFIVALGIFFSCDMWDLVPWPGIKPRLPATGGHSPGHWITRAVPGLFLHILSMPAFLLLRHSLVSQKTHSLWNWRCLQLTKCGAEMTVPVVVNKKMTRKVMVWHGRVTSRGTMAAIARLGKVTRMRRSAGTELKPHTILNWLYLLSMLSNKVSQAQWLQTKFINPQLCN